jgi:hypothetical protein
MRDDHEGAGARAWHHHLSRRQLLRIGGVGSLGLALPGLLQAEAEGTAPRGSAAGPIRSCILIFYYGGPSHIDTFDMKPNAPAEIRGQFGSIATSVPGLRVCEHLPFTARVIDRLAIVRSMHHPMTNHNAAAFTALCGRNPLKGDLELLGNDRNDPPCLGAILSGTLPERRGLPTFVALPHVMYNVVQLPGQVAGFLGSAHDPFQVSADPSAPSFQMGELELPGDLPIDRLDDRAALAASTRLPGQPPGQGRARRQEPLPALRRVSNRVTCTRRKRLACSIRRRCGGRFTWPRKTLGCATATVAPSSGKACF